MQTKKVTFEELVAGAILKFGKVGSLDITLLIEGLHKFNSNIEYVDSPISFLHKYIQTKNGVMSIKDELRFNNSSLFANQQDFSLEHLLRIAQGQIVYEYLTKLNLENFVLRKFKELKSVACDKIDDFLNPVEQQITTQLVEKRMLNKRWNDDISHQDFQEFYITQLGKVQLFMEENKTAITNFIECLKELKYNPKLLTDFLITQDLEQSPIVILDIANFINFGNVYDINLERIKNKNPIK